MGSSDVATLEDDILRIDLSISGLKKIRGIPIELGGVRSYCIDYKVDKDLIDRGENK